MLSNEKMTL